MARVTENGISGLVGTVVLYSMNGKNYMRSKPRTRVKKRGAPSRPENVVFGKVSKYGSRMIKNMAGSFLFPVKLTTYNALRGWMRNQYAEHAAKENWELSARRNATCQLHTDADLRDFISFDITVSDKGNGIINVAFPVINPVQDIRAPLRTTKLNIKMIASTSAFKERLNPDHFCMEQVSYDFNGNVIPAQEIVLDTKANTGDIAIIVIALEFEITDKSTKTYNTEKRWLPAAVVAMGRLS